MGKIHAPKDGAPFSGSVRPHELLRQIPMKLNLNTPQRVAVFAAAGAIVIFQLVSFNSNGVEGYGWVFAFLVAGVLLFVGLASNQPVMPAVPPADKAIDAATATANEGARAMASLAGKLATQLEKHFRNNNLQPAVSIPGSSVAIESIFPVFTLAAVAYLETNSPALTTEFIIFRELFAKAARGFIAHSVDSWDKEQLKETGYDPATLPGITTQMQPHIQALTNARISGQYDVARECIALQGKGDPQPLLPIYMLVAVGSKCSTEELQRRFETPFSMILGSFRRELDSHYAA